DRHVRGPAEVDEALMDEHARHDEVDPALEVAGDVTCRLALPELDVTWRQADRRAELHHADLERHPGPETRLLEDHREGAPREQRVRPMRAQIGLQPACELEDRLDLRGGEIRDAEEIALHAVASAPSRISSASSTSSAVTIKGGVIRSTRSAVQLMSKPPSRQRATMSPPGPSSRSPCMSPSPRTSRTRRWRAARRSRPSRSRWPIDSAWARKSRSAIVSRAATAAAQARGLPPNVVPCAPGVKTGAMRWVVQSAPIGTPPPSAFASAMMSGVTPACS